jgi:hypothetical protein
MERSLDLRTFESELRRPVGADAALDEAGIRPDRRDELRKAVTS